MIESLKNVFSAKKHPYQLFWYGIIYSSIAILFSLWIFREHASLLMVFLTVLAISPLMYSTIKNEEKNDVEIKDENKLLQEHISALKFFMYFFFGVTLSFALWYTFLPLETSQILFSAQTDTIKQINGAVTEASLDFSGAFYKILFNNLRVLAFCLLFAFVYGVGAIFILTWNASVIGVAMGTIIRSNISNISLVFGADKIMNYFSAIYLGLIRYVIHGVPEVMAYFVGGLAGGIISVAIIKQDLIKESSDRIIKDASILILIAIVLLVIAAFLEVFITPNFY